MVHIVNKLLGTSAKMRVKKRNRQHGQAMTEFVVMGPGNPANHAPAIAN